jgi:DNA-binding CsgD family transcriptional regulator
MAARNVPVNGHGREGGSAPSDGTTTAGSCLSGREIDVLRLMAAGFTNRQVASTLHMSRHTVAHHLGQMLRRTGARSRGELIARAYAAEIFMVGIWPPSPTGNNRMHYVSARAQQDAPPAGYAAETDRTRARQVAS